MALRIKLRRTGTKNAPRYRVVVAEAMSKRDGKFVEALGHYDPTKEPAQFAVNEDRALHWLKVGALPTATVRSLLARVGVMKKLAEHKAAARAARRAA